MNLCFTKCVCVEKHGDVIMGEKMKMNATEGQCNDWKAWSMCEKKTLI